MRKLFFVNIVVSIAAILLFTVRIIPGEADQLLITGKVFAGSFGNETTSIAGVTLELRGANSIDDLTGTLLDTAVTDPTGSYGLDVTSELYAYLNVIESNPEHYVSVGASSVAGMVRNANWIQYTTPLGSQDLTGNKFWDEPPAYTFEGRVYRGEVGDESRPLSGVTLSLYLSNTSCPDLGSQVDTAVTDGNGWYSLSTSTNMDYYHIIQTDLAGYSSMGATSVGGTVCTSNAIDYAVPLAGKTLTGNKFWDTMPMISGRVFAGPVGIETIPIPGVAVHLYGTNSADFMGGDYLSSFLTDENGWYGLDVTTGLYDYLNVIEFDPGAYTSMGSTSVGGSVKNSNWIQYATPLTGKDLTGNKFWDQVSTPLYSFEGRVFRGEVGNETIPLPGVTVNLLLSNSGYPSLGGLVASAVTDINGWYSLSTSTDMDYYQIVQDNLPGYVFKGATSVDGMCAHVQRDRVCRTTVW